MSLSKLVVVKVKILRGSDSWNFVTGFIMTCHYLISYNTFKIFDYAVKFCKYANCEVNKYVYFHIYTYSIFENFIP